MRRLLVVLVAVLPAVSFPTPAGAVQRNADGATAAAVALSRLEAAGDFDALYDRLHPDAKKVVPQAAVVGWYEADFAPLGPGVITVQSARFEDWTWAVTGKRYPDTAVVAYTQPFADGTVAEDVVRLVQHEGGWGWFFGRDRAFVDEQIERFVNQNRTPTAETQTIQGVWEAADRACTAFADYWMGSPRFSAESVATLSGCWQAEDGSWFLPVNGEDPRLPPDARLRPEAEQQTRALRQQIEQQLDGFDRLMRSRPNPFVVAAQAGNSTLRDGLYDLYDPEAGTVQGSSVSGGVPNPRAPGIKIVRRTYGDLFSSYVLNPDNYALVEYARWLVQRRIGAIPPGFIEQLNPRLQPAIREDLGLIYTPWPWELANPLTLDAYLAWAMVNGRVPMTPLPPSGGNRVADLQTAEAGGGPNPPVRLTVVITDGENFLGGACAYTGSPRSPYSACDGSPQDLDGRPGRIAMALMIRGDLVITETSPPLGHALSTQRVSVTLEEEDVEVTIRHDD